MEENYYNVADIYGVHVAWDEWDSRDHWELCLEGLENIGGVLISNERYGGTAGCKDTLKDYDGCAEDIERLDIEIEDIAFDIANANADEDTADLVDVLIGLVEDRESFRRNFERFKMVEGRQYNLLVDMERYSETTGDYRPKEGHLEELLRECTTAALVEVETIRVVEIEQCPNWVEEITHMTLDECEELGGFKMTVDFLQLIPSKIVPFLMEEGLALSKRHKIERVDV